MSRIKNQSGFTLIELVVAMVLVGVIGTAFITFINTSLSQYFGLEREGLAFGDLASQSQRIAKVLRGTTDIVAATNDEVTVYAFFAPNDTYTSKVRYYKGANGKVLYAEVTPMTANAPIGSLITSSMKTYTIIPNFYSATGVKLFEYLDSVGGTISTPIADLHTVKGIRITLSVPADATVSGASDTIISEVALRNRKTNL